MLKKISYAVAVLSVACVAVGISALAKVKSSEADAPVKSHTGFMIGRPVLKPMVPPLLTRDDLVTKGHAEDKMEIAALFQTYMLYHDTHDGEGVASLFTKDGALEHLWNNGGKTVEPNAGPNGKGCFSPGHDEIVEMFEAGRGPGGGTPLPFSGHSHNQTTNVSVQVYGDTATLYGNFTSVVSNTGDPAKLVTAAPNSAVVTHNGEDVADLRRTPQGWRFVHLRVLEDEQMKFGTASCERNVVQAQ